MTTTLTRQALEKKLSQNLGLSRWVSKQLVNSYFALISENLAQDKIVLIGGLGRFALKKRAKRQGRNLLTGEVVEIPSQLNPSFTLSRSLRTIIKEA